MRDLVYLIIAVFLVWGVISFTILYCAVRSAAVYKQQHPMPGDYNA